MASDVIDGLRISLVGMSLTFLALVLLILVMVVLVRLFPERGAEGDRGYEAEPLPAEEDDLLRQEEMAVAIAVGLCLLEREDAFGYRDPSLGKLLER